ncbi:MAG: phosphatase PAP2 family protein [Desulfofustis sp. PB-SRB1]|mgnify:CR=1 FL=1|jgi:lipid A 4'-phosphatase|nr:phosphatase PAP2 family protein [Desulfofustis sp. PB-SRB1]MBM1001950.1 phosphatase PAP2 family protein [Desulfofustis sp. PB-SRB1]
MSKSFFTMGVIPLLLAAAVTVPFYIWDIDLIAQSYFYQDGHWYLRNNKALKLLYDYGPIPGLAVAVIGLLIFIVGLFFTSMRRTRRVGLFLVLFMAVGSGLVVNALFKEYWGRPRPREVIEFGGAMHYIPPLKRGELILTTETTQMLETREGAVAWDYLRNIYKIKGEYNSFPAGHASVGFYLMFGFFIWRGRGLRLVSLAVGIGYGMAMGLARTVQGAHFLSDVIWAGFIMYFTGLVLYWVIGLQRTSQPRKYVI